MDDGIEIKFSSERADLDKVRAILNNITEGNFSYETVEEDGISIVRITCDHAAFHRFAREFGSARLIPTEVKIAQMTLSGFRFAETQTDS